VQKADIENISQADKRVTKTGSTRPLGFNLRKIFSRIRLDGDRVLREKPNAGSVQNQKSLKTTYKRTPPMYIRSPEKSQDFLAKL